MSRNIRMPRRREALYQLAQSFTSTNATDCVAQSVRNGHFAVSSVWTFDVPQTRSAVAGRLLEISPHQPFLRRDFPNRTEIFQYIMHMVHANALNESYLIALLATPSLLVLHKTARIDTQVDRRFLRHYRLRRGSLPEPPTAPPETQASKAERGPPVPRPSFFYRRASRQLGDGPSSQHQSGALETAGKVTRLQGLEVATVGSLLCYARQARCPHAIPWGFEV